MARKVSQMYFLLTTVSCIFMGMNFILFLFCTYVLWGQKSKSRRLLLLSSFLQFALCLAQAILYIVYLVVAFAIYPAGPESYFLRHSSFSLPCYIIFIIDLAIEGMLLIWRVYLLYDYNIMFCIPLIMLLLLQIALSGVTAKGFATEAFVTGSRRAFNLATWALIAAVNTTATVLICVRLWIASQRTHGMLSESKYKSTIIVVVECGCLVTMCSVAMLIVYAVQHQLILAGVGITTQIATLAPLLIVARHGILSRQDDRRSLASRMPLRISVLPADASHRSSSAESEQKKRLSEPFPQPLEAHELAVNCKGKAAFQAPLDVPANLGTGESQEASCTPEPIRKDSLSDPVSGPPGASYARSAHVTQAEDDA